MRAFSKEKLLTGPDSLAVASLPIAGEVLQTPQFKTY